MNDDSKCPVSGKRKYLTEGEALSTAAHQMQTAHAPNLRVYRCAWCDAWHLTKAPDKPKDKPKDKPAKDRRGHRKG